MSIFQEPNTLTPEQKVSKQIDKELRQVANSMKVAYLNVRKLIYQNPAFVDEYGVFDPNKVFAAFSENTTTGLTVEQLGDSARITKAVLNEFAPGTIVDSVPPASITL